MHRVFVRITEFTNSPDLWCLFRTRRLWNLYGSRLSSVAGPFLTLGRLWATKRFFRFGGLFDA